MGSVCCVSARRYDRPVVTWEEAADAAFAEIRNERMARESVGMQPEARILGSSEDQLLSVQVKTKAMIMMPANESQSLSALHDMPSLSLSTSTLPRNINLAPASSTPSKWSPGIHRSHFLRQRSDSLLCGTKPHGHYSVSDGTSSPAYAVSSIESIQHSHGGSIDGLSVQSLPESTTSTHKKTRSFDSNSFKLAESQSHKPDAHSVEMNSCVLCSKCVADYSVVAVLACGHVYHADCLEHLTPEISKYDPTCPVCTLGDKGAMKKMEKLLNQNGRIHAKLSEKLLNNGMDTKAKNKKHRNRVISSDLDVEVPLGANRYHEAIPSLRSSLSKPFLKRHFSINSTSKATSSTCDKHSIKHRSLLWSKSSK